MEKRSYILILILIVSISLLGFFIGNIFLNKETSIVNEDFDLNEEIAEEVILEEPIEIIDRKSVV